MDRMPWIKQIPVSEATGLLKKLFDEAPPPPLAQWFARYNARQTIEAGIKEGKGVFTLKRHLVRSPIGMQLQEQFALFGANFVRWPPPGSRTCCVKLTAAFPPPSAKSRPSCGLFPALGRVGYAMPVVIP